MVYWSISELVSPDLHTIPFRLRRPRVWSCHVPVIGHRNGCVVTDNLYHIIFVFFKLYKIPDFYYAKFYGTFGRTRSIRRRHFSKIFFISSDRPPFDRYGRVTVLRCRHPIDCPNAVTRLSRVCTILHFISSGVHRLIRKSPTP